MEKKKLTGIAGAAISAALCLAFLPACSATGGVAATVNGHEIAEDEVNQRIEQIRTSRGITGDAEWGAYLVEQSMTPESFREQIVSSLVSVELSKQGADSLGVSLDTSRIDDTVAGMKAAYSEESGFSNALKDSKTNEERYRESLEISVREEQLTEMFAQNAEVDDDDIVEAFNNYASNYDGMKKSSHIMFKLDDKDNAEKVLADIKAGSMTFEEAVKKYSVDEHAPDGNIGWNALGTPTAEYADALENLDKDGLSELVEDAYGYHIIKCTDVFTFPEDGVNAVSEIPAELKPVFESVAKMVKASSDYTEWLDGLEKDATIVVNNMPDGAKYNIDLTKYREEKEKKDAEAAAAANANASSTPYSNYDTSTSIPAGDTSGIQVVDGNGNDITSSVTGEPAGESTSGE